MVFVFSLMLVTYTYYASQNKNVASARNSYAANTLSQALETELSVTSDPEASSELWRYLRFNIGQKEWPYYCPEAEFGGHGEEEAFRYFNLNYNYVEKYFSKTQLDDEGNVYKSGDIPDSLAGFPGSVKLCIYWRLPEKYEAKVLSEKRVTGPEPGDDDFTMSGARLYIEIICETASQTYVVTNEYMLNVLDDYDVSSENKRLRKTLETAASDDTAKARINPYGLSVSDLDKHWVWEFISRE